MTAGTASGSPRQGGNDRFACRGGPYTLSAESLRRHRSRIRQETMGKVFRTDLGVAASACCLLSRQHGTTRSRGEALEVFLGGQRRRCEALLNSLLGHTHRTADLRPGRAGASCAIDEMPDQVVPQVT